MAHPGCRAVVFGGAGFIGTHLVRELAASGREVLVADIRRPHFDLPSGVRFVSVDVRRPIDLNLSSAEVVFNLAAVHRTPGHADHEYYDTNVGGALNITEWCESTRVDQLVFTSSISVYGPTEQQKDESSPLTPNISYGRSKLMAEQIHRQWTTRGDRRVVIARPAVVFGPGEGGNFTRLASALQRRRFVYPGRDDTVKACGYVSDLVRALLFGLQRREPEFTFNYCYPRSYTIRDICEAFHEVAGFAPPRRLPVPVTDIALRRLGTLSSLDRTGALSPERIRKLTASTNIVPTALREAGFSWNTDLLSGLRAWQAAAPTGSFV